jgi:integrase
MFSSFRDVHMTELLSASIVTFSAQAITLDQLIAIWLAEKTRRTRSGATARAYRTALSTFRALLQAASLDLDSDPVLLATLAQGWADLRDRGDGPIASATYNQRLAILSSFYQTAIKKGYLTANPITRVERRPVDDYAEAKALESGELRQCLAAIDRTTLRGQRDYALLGVLLNTGRRRAEVNAMRWSAVQLANGEVTLSFPRTKGGKSMRDTLPSAVGTALLAWLHAFYGTELGDLAPDAPVWASLSPNSYGKPLSKQAFGEICAARLGVSKVHVLRHTFADAMEQSGAAVSEIQARLGHASIATTGRYLTKLRRAKNRHGEQIASMFGFDAE